MMTGHDFKIRGRCVIPVTGIHIERIQTEIDSSTRQGLMASVQAVILMPAW